MAPRKRTKDNAHLINYPSLGIYTDGRYFFKNPYTGRQRSLKTRDFKQAVGRWALAKAICDKAHGDNAGAALLANLQGSNKPISKCENIHLKDFICKWRVEMLEPGKVTVKIKRGMGKPLTARTVEDYRKMAVQLERLPAGAFPIGALGALSKIRIMLSPWIATPTHYNHLKAVLGRIYDHAVLVGLVERNPMRDIEKMGVAKREVLIPDEAYKAITRKLMVHQMNKQVFDGQWRVKICDLFYMLSQQPVDLFSLRMSQFMLDHGQYGEISLSRAKTKVTGIIEMNREMRETVNWLIAFRTEQLRLIGNVFAQPKTDHLLVYPAYFDLRSRWRPVKHRTFSGWWAEAVEEVGIKGEYRLMDLRKKGLTDEFVSQGENDKGLHETDAMKRHYRLIVPPKRSKNTLTPIGDKKP